MVIAFIAGFITTIFGYQVGWYMCARDNRAREQRQRQLAASVEPPVVREPTRLVIGRTMFITDVDGTRYVGDNGDHRYRSHTLPNYMTYEDGSGRMPSDVERRLEAYFRAKDLRAHATATMLAECDR